MTAIRIPLVPVGPGTQPADADGAELDLITLPDSMVTYTMPDLPEPEQAAVLPEAMAVLRRALELLEEATSEGGGSDLRDCLRSSRPASGAIDLVGLDAANLALVNQTLGEGEVSVIGLDLAIQESVLAGVWRVQQTRTDGHGTDTVEVGPIPAAVFTAAESAPQSTLRLQPEQLPPGLQNAPSLIAELNQAIASRTVEGEPYVINLSLLPHTPEDLLWLAEILGAGTLTILSRGYGNCRITSTATRHVWWVQYFNSQDLLILNTLEVTPVPLAACASREDLEDSRERLQEILQVIG